MGLCWWLIGSRGRADRHVRVDMPARALGGTIRQPPRAAWIDQEHADGGTAVFQWPTVDAELDAMNRCRGLARLVIDVDDCPFSERTAMVAALNAVPTVHSRAELRRQLEQEHRRQGMCVSALRHADAVTCASRALADELRRHNPNVFYVPNQVDAADWPAPTKPNDVKFRVGFFGSTSHSFDLPLVRPALQWAAAQDNVEVIVGGWHPGGPLSEADHLAFDEHVMEQRLDEAAAITAAHAARWNFPITVVDWTDDYATHAANLCRLDIGLAPCDDVASVFSPWRSDLKVLEYLMAGVLPIISRSQALKDWWDLVPTADDAQGFVDHVQWAVENRDETHARAMELRDHVLAERTIQANLWRWREALQPTAPVAATGPVFWGAPQK